MKKSLRYFFGGLAVLLIVAFICLVVINWGDAALDPQLAQLLEQKRTATPDEVEAYQYLLGLRADEKADPLEVGRRAYAYLKAPSEERGVFKPAPEFHSFDFPKPESLCGKANYCPAETIKEDRARVDQDLKAGRLAVSRFDHLLERYPSYASDEVPDIALMVDASNVLRAFKFKLLSWSLSVQTGDKKQIAATIHDLERCNLFFARSLSRSESILSTMVMLKILNSTRDFAVGAARAQPLFRSALTQTLLSSFRVDAGFERIAEGALNSETQITGQLINSPTDFCDLQRANLGPEREECRAILPKAVSQAFVSLLLKRHLTLNMIYHDNMAALHAKCVRTADTCPELDIDKLYKERMGWTKWQNPIGRGYTLIFGTVSPQVFKRMYAETKALNEPLDLSKLVSKNR